MISLGLVLECVVPIIMPYIHVQTNRLSAVVSHQLCRSTKTCKDTSVICDEPLCYQRFGQRQVQLRDKPARPT